MEYSVEKALGRIEAMIDIVREDIEEVRDLLREQNGRIRALEINHAEIKGGWKVAGIMGGIAGGLASYLPRFWS